MDSSANETLTLTCPAPRIDSGDRIMLAHGEGGKLMRQLIRGRLVPKLDNEFLRIAGDAAVLPACPSRLAFTTDSFVVAPLFFPGGDIGSLAVFGTCNDLVVAGARPRWISLSLIVEEGLELAMLDRVLESIAVAARRVGVSVVTGDTKVVPRGVADKIFINTAGLGEFIMPPPPGPSALGVGDELIVTGPIGRHGVAVLAAREELGFVPPPVSDMALLADAVTALHRNGIRFKALRDATRGGVGAVFHEWANDSATTLIIEEDMVPVTDEVRGVCELLGLDPIHVANEGTMLIAVPSGEADRCLAALRDVKEATSAVRIGRVAPREIAAVVIERPTGQRMPLDEPIGAPLPRIC
jgi:hydrogenase expression/formation protein HypE